MKTALKNQRAIALLSILAGIVYSLSIFSSLLGGIQGAKESLWEKNFSKQLNNSSSYKKISLISNDDYFITDSVLNLKDHTFAPLIHSEVDVVAMEEPKTLLGIFIMMFQMLTMIFLIPFIFVFPVLFYKLIFAIYKGEIFTTDNVRRLNNMGCLIVISYILIALFAYLDYIERKSMVMLENYHIAPPDFLGSSSFVLIGIIALIAGQVMKKALLMKEEQDLTV